MATSNMEQRIQQLVEKLRTASEKSGVDWREGPGKSYILSIGDYAITVSKDNDPQLAIFDHSGEELEAVERAELESHTASDGRNYAELCDKVWRLARRSAGSAEAAFDKILNILDGKASGESAPQPVAAPVEMAAEPEQAEEPDFAPQAPQAGMDEVEEAPTEAEAEADKDDNSAVQRPAAQTNGTAASANDDDDDDDDTPARRPFWS